MLDSSSNIGWCWVGEDSSAIDLVSAIVPEKINHFPGMNEICRKDLLARNLNRMLKMFPKEYNVFPKTWCLPADYGDFQAYTRQKKNKTYILKPESGCQGRGIWLTRNPKDIKPHEHMICQVYTTRPYLIDGFKFDLRIYTLVTSCDPLRIFVFKDGLARFATNKYSEPTNNNADNVYMHLTNYAINKNSEDFVRDDEAGSKRRISTINRYLQEKGVDVDKLWADIDDVIIKTLISAHSVLKHNYRTCFPNHVKGSACFEILGFDILLDRRLRPYIIEVNHSPSFSTDAQLDREIKGTLIWDTLGLVNFGAIDRRRCLEEERRRIKDRLLGKNTKKETKEEMEVAQQQYLEQLERYENNHMGNFRRIFPTPGCEKYDKYFHSSGTLFQETAAFRARSELARQQREEIMRKKEKMESMLKGRKRTEGLRPESPTGRRKQRTTWRSNTSFRPRLAHTSSHLEDPRAEEAVDTRVPMDILEEEELERISGLLQRDNLVRGLGIVEHVYRLLHCTPGTIGVVRPETKPQPLPLTGVHRYPLYPGKTYNACLCASGQRHPPPPQVRPKDKMYYKKLLDRYFGANHALTREFEMRAVSDTAMNRSSNALGNEGSGKATQVVTAGNPAGATVIQLTEPDDHEPSPAVLPAGARGGPNSVSSLAQHFTGTHTLVDSISNLTIPLSTHQHVYPLASLAALHGSINPFAAMSAVNTELSSADGSAPQSAPAHGPQRWPMKSKSLGNLNERTVPAYQRTKLARKPITGTGGIGRPGVVVQESDLRSMAGMMDTEAERNRLLARNGYTYQGYTQAPAAAQGYASSGYQSDWRSDSSTPARPRVLSAHRQQRDGDVGLTRFIAQHPSHGLSVVSAPAPVVQRPDVVSPNTGQPRQTQPVSIGPSTNALDTLNSQRSTKSQRIRGATNSMRLRQLEMRENHAFVFS
ncbi:hypothetical protein BaRGS_00036089 [Batillaria attramentaria]|uniref:Tubulin polyglutamylase ttll6 n=1 Tax=Batillaria attramentaria TaxID=370345 RepID=A0ABD0JCH7_9CAEN